MKYQKLQVFFVCFLIIILFYMSVETWGLMPKSQIDNETVEEAIARLIATHEADPDAHLGSGESLENHRANEILDHLAGSVVDDKLSMSEISLKESFLDLIKLNKVGTVSNSNYPQIEFSASSALGRTASIYLPVVLVEDWVTFHHDWQCQFIARISDLPSVATWWAGEGFNGAVSNGGVGFVVVSGSLYAQENIGSNLQRVLISGVDLSAGHIFRIQYLAGENVIKYFIDSTLVATIEPDDVDSGTDIGPSFGENVPTGTSEADFILGGLIYSRSLL